MAKPRMFSRLLDTIGDGTGEKNANVDGRSTPVIFRLKPPGGSFTGGAALQPIATLARLLVTIRGAGKFSAEKYGPRRELSKGIQLGIFSTATDELLEDYTDGVPIKTSAGWSRVCYDVELKTWGSGDSFLAVRWSFSKALEAPTIQTGRYFGVRIQDNLSRLVEHYFTVQGWQR